MIRGPRLFALFALTGLALASLLLTFRMQPIRTPEQASLTTDYFFRNADIALIGADGRAAFLVNANRATMALDNETLILETVDIRREGPRPWSLSADTARLWNEGADIIAEENVRLTFGPSGQWVADARHARIRTDGPSLTLTRAFRIHRPDAGPRGSAISGEHIILEPESTNARTDRPVRLKIGGIEFESNGLNAQIGEQLITLDRDVRLVADE